MSVGAQAVDILAYGEPMVEFNQTGEGGGRLYLQGFGGDTSNFAVAAARQGARVGYLSALGDDPYGAMLRALWTAPDSYKPARTNRDITEEAAEIRATDGALL